MHNRLGPQWMAAVSLLLWTGVALAQPAARQPVLLERVAAVVNNEIILESEVQRRLAQARQAIAKAKQPAPPEDRLREQVLDRMVNDLALLQRATQVGLSVDDNTLHRAIARIAEQNGMSVEGLSAQLQSEGIAFERFRQDIREEILLTRLREREVDNRLTVSEAEIDAFLAAQGASLSRSEEWRVSQILLDSEAKAKAVAQRLQGGEDFAAVARELSLAPDATNGGDLGWRGAERLPTIFMKAVEKLQPGQWTGPFQSPGGFHILRLEDRRSSIRSQVVDVFRARHILIRVDAQTSEQTAIRRLQELRRRLSLGEAFEQLAKDFSQDPGSAAKGGQLDWAYPGDLVPEFERAALGLARGQVSEPVRTVFGFHLIEVLDRKQEPLTEDRLRLIARLSLRDRKLADAVDDWTREIRANSYVEIKRDDS
jgi:peptidyl-prolyl cis-trans isomerase SurA